MYDKHLAFSEAQAITASAASTNLVDLSAARTIAVGRPIWFVAHVTTAFTDAGSDSTVTITIETDTAAAFGSATTLQTIGVFAATAAAGTMLKVPLAVGTAEQYVRAYYTVANGNLTTGAITAYLSDEPVQEATAYANGYTITHS